MDIQCAGCGIHLGTIHKASLRKNIVHLCNVCEAKRKKALAFADAKASVSGVSPGIFNDLFGGAFRGL